MDDIVPGLLETIQADFKKSIKDNPALNRIAKLIEEGTATYKEASEYAEWIGQLLSTSIKRNVTATALPDGRMYYNIAERILGDSLKGSQELISKATSTIQDSLNKSAGIGMKSVKPPLNKDRIAGLVNKISGEEDFEKVKWLLDEPVVNFNRSIVDDFVKINADFHARSGLSPVLHRIAEPSCCDWCSNLAGTYDYRDAPDEIYRRHERCKCRVEYDPGEGKRQNVWTKGWS